MVAWELTPVRWVVATMFATPVGFPLCRRILDTDRQGLGLCKTFRGGTVPRPDSMTITDKLFAQIQENAGRHRTLCMFKKMS